MVHAPVSDGGKTLVPEHTVTVNNGRYGRGAWNYYHTEILILILLLFIYCYLYLRILAEQWVSLSLRVIFSIEPML